MGEFAIGQSVLRREDTLDIARDAAERVAVDYAPRPAMVSARDAFE
jgi:CO/xanthine dehydrogenase Mo-binding subunit